MNPTPTAKSFPAVCCCRRAILAMAIAGLLVVPIADTAVGAIISFVADPINAANETPCPQAFAGSGVGVFNLDDVTGVVIGKVVYSNLGSPENNAHVHRGAICVAGGVVYPIPLGTPKNITSPVLTAAQMTDMLGGLHYVNIHTNLAPGGQIRGQIVRLTAGLGACCNKGGTECLITDASRCQMIGGVFQGVGTMCTAKEACCIPNPASDPPVTCVMVDPICCDDLGGFPQGVGTDCNQPNICACGPDPLAPDRCKQTPCPIPGELCLPRCVKYNPFSGQSTVLDCVCRPDDQCRVVVPQPNPTACPPPLPRGSGNGCVVPDSGGTAVLPPPNCGYLSPDDVHMIIDGLPPGTTILLGTEHLDFVIQNQGPGGSLGGEFEQFVSALSMHLCGTGNFSNYNRFITMGNVQCETHIAPRAPGNPTQSFDNRMWMMQGQIVGDPDFDLLRITAGNAFALPSPGHTTLTQLPGAQWAVDSFFDITYRIDFVGAPGGPFAGMSGSTTGTIRMSTGQTPSCAGNCPPGTVCEETRVTNADGSIDVCCNCVTPQPCEPDPVAPSRCRQTQCPTPTETCKPKCVKYNPSTGQSTVLDCECGPDTQCHAEIPAGGASLRGSGNPCQVPDNGNGTVTLPPAGCEYLSPDEVHQIIDGLPAGTTIELAAIHKDFICHAQQGGTSVCSFPPPIPGVDCDDAGGSLGGEKECADSNLQLNMQGTGTLAGFNRMLTLPISFETHTAPRIPGDPIQSFDTDMFRLFGQITNPGAGDPDFDLLRIVAGTDFGLPSPGHTTLTQLPGGNWAVDSFFDITYRIDFVGAPGGALAGMSGSTTGTIRMATGMGPNCVGDCPPGLVCDEQRVVQPDGTIDICCNCVTPVCEPDPLAASQCRPVQCPNLGEVCQPRCARYDPATGQSVVTACECGPDTECHVLMPGVVGGGMARGGGTPCTVPDAGGTVALPPAGCSYLSPEGFHEIVNGLPAGTSIEIGPEHLQFFCRTGGMLCSLPPGTACRQMGGSLGGEVECFDSSLMMQMNGTGGLMYNRMLTMQLECETHVGPRMPGQPVQSFDTEMFRMQGQLPPGDPDFDLLKITAGGGFGMPSPGHTTLTQLPGGMWAVDSFFDIFYEIEFSGAPGGPFAGMSGSTTGTIRMATGQGPSCIGGCPPGFDCVQGRRVNLDGTIDICCRCVRPCQCLGDLNLDCLLNGRDIQLFIDCLLRNPQPNPLDHPCNCADMNGDGRVSMADVAPFVGQLLAVPKVQCPPNCVPGP